ncbi:hypothetical protein NUSPORA_00087 [Nucleospora cyclopteri]
MALIDDLSTNKSIKPKHTDSKVMLLDDMNKEQYNQNKNLPLKEQRFYLENMSLNNDKKLHHIFLGIFTVLYFFLFMIVFSYLHSQLLYKLSNGKKVKVDLIQNALRDITIALAGYIILYLSTEILLKRRRGQ